MSRITPEYARKVRKEQSTSREGNAMFGELLSDEKMLGLGSYKDRAKAIADQAAAEQDRADKNRIFDIKGQANL